MSDLTDDHVRTILKQHRDGGPISRLYATGEIEADTVPALGMLSTQLEEDGRHEDAEQLGDVIGYALSAGERPPVAGWVAKL
ncbi:hypothetical protein [Streptomyces chryseus]|uniref:Uncharacterized protein n=2 Tax=Streptomyces chryseus TaxID=68186 RepID=A0ABQ3DI87_9ACTN|nr:hypothetical protein [Streptomyces chryseus]GHA94561.1 hypothetical protein GCM10010346_16670 [Streptomyces chryseus]